MLFTYASTYNAHKNLTETLPHLHLHCAYTSHISSSSFSWPPQHLSFTQQTKVNTYECSPFSQQKVILAVGVCLLMCITFISILVHVFCFNQPVHVADHVLLHLLFLLGFLQLTTTHGLFSFFRELTVMCIKHTNYNLRLYSNTIQCL